MMYTAFDVGGCAFMAGLIAFVGGIVIGYYEGRKAAK